MQRARHLPPVPILRRVLPRVAELGHVVAVPKQVETTLVAKPAQQIAQNVSRTGPNSD